MQIGRKLGLKRTKAEIELPHAQEEEAAHTHYGNPGLTLQFSFWTKILI